MIKQSLLFLFLLSCVHSNTFDDAFDDPQEKKNILDLSSMGITRLKNYFFNTSIKTYINLSNNEIASIDDAATDGVSNLVYLNLSGNSRAFYAFGGEFSNLETLVLDGPTLSTRENEDQPCDDYEFEKSHRRYVYLNNDVSMLFFTSIPKLKKLYLRGKNIAEIVDLTKEVLPNLTHLYLNGNNLRSAQFFQYLAETLTHLCLNNNNITEIGYDKERHEYKDYWNVNETAVEPYNLQNLMDLLHLDMSHNKISHILDHTFDNLTALITLRLDYNQLSSIPDIRGLKSLKSFSVAHNKIRKINQAIFGSSELKKINLSSNCIDEISDDSFNDLTSLEKLDLSRNSLKSLPENWISRTNVRYLYLHNNLFENFDNLSLVGARNLRYLSIGGNPLKLTNLKVLMSLSEDIIIDFS